jgi:mono/diheme cytochrome c family protein
MKRIIVCAALLLLMPSAYAASLPGDSAEGKRLLDANCMECHQTDIYTRKDRHVQSLDALKAQVVGCTHMADAQSQFDMLIAADLKFVPADFAEVMRAPSSEDVDALIARYGARPGKPAR